MAQLFKHLLALVLAAGLSACGTDSSSGEEGSTLDETAAQSTAVTVTQSSSPVAAPSTLSLRLTDAPITGLVRVVVQFTAVELKRQSGGWVRYDLATPASIDLLQLQGATTADLLLNVPVDADDYKELRLYTDAAANVNYVEETAGGIEPLQIPGGSGGGLILKQDFTISSDEMASYVIDIDLLQSVRSPGGSGNYQLMPVWRLVSVTDSGHIPGTVDPALLTAPSCFDADADSHNAVYVFAGHDVVADDINQSTPGSVEPMTTTSIVLDTSSGAYVYDAAFIPAGDYTVALTCNTILEDLDQDDNLQFFGMRNATVLHNNTIFLR